MADRNDRGFLGSEKLTKTWKGYIKGRESGNGDGDDYRNLLLEHYLPKAHKLAGIFSNHVPSQTELDDLESIAVLGMMDAMKAFDPERGVLFETYFAPRVRGSMIDYMRAQDHAPRLVRARESTINDAVKLLREKLDREPYENELLKELKKKKYGDNSLPNTSLDKRKKKARGIIADGYRVHNVLSGSTLVNSEYENKQITLLDLASGSVDPDTSLDYSDLVERVLERMPERDRRLIEMYYLEETSMKKVGEAIDVSESRVSQRHDRLIEWMRMTANDIGGGCVNAQINDKAKIPPWRKRRAK